MKNEWIVPFCLIVALVVGSAGVWCGKEAKPSDSAILIDPSIGSAYQMFP